MSELPPNDSNWEFEDEADPTLRQQDGRHDPVPMSRALPFQFHEDLMARWQRPSPKDERLLDHARSVLEATLPLAELEELGLLPERLNPPVIPSDQAKAHWTGLLEADGGSGGRITTVRLEELTAFVDATNSDPGTDWVARQRAHRRRPGRWLANFVAALTGDELATPPVDPQSQHLHVCAQLSQAHPVRVVIQFDLWTWLGRAGPARNVTQRTFQIRLVDLAQGLGRLTEIENLDLAHVDRWTRLRDGWPLTCLTQLTNSLDSVVNHPQLPAQARTRVAETLQYAPRYALDHQDPVVVLAQLYRTLNAAGLEVTHG